MTDKMQVEKTSKVSYVVFIAALVVVALNLVSLFFPALFTTLTSESESQVDPFELGVSTVPVLVTNLALLGFGILYYKKKLPNIIRYLIKCLFDFEVSPKVAGIVIVILVGGYIAFTSQDLSANEEDEHLDFKGVKSMLKDYPFTEMKDYRFTHVKNFFLYSSQEVFGNIKIIPFIGSISLLLMTYLFTVEITKKRFAGLVALVILLQSYTFLRYDTIATYPNFWTLFYLLSLYLIYKRWHLSPVTYLLSIFSKPLAAMFLPMTLFLTYRADIPKRKKIRITISYVIIFVVMLAISLASVASGERTIAGDQLGFDYSEFWSGFTKWTFQLRFDWLVLLFLLPLTVGLFLTSRKGILEADSILILLMGILLSAPLLSGFTGFLIHPYRFMPLIVFFAIGVGTLLSKKIIQRDEIS